MPTQPITARELEASELRIGNQIITVFSGIEIPSTIEDGLDIQGVKERPDLYKPILLTTEWLEWFGFRYKNPRAGGQDSWAGYGFWELPNSEFNLIGTKSGTVYFQRCWDWQITSVHQLQNLYFALTAQELKINI